MSADRSNNPNRPLKPTIAANYNARAPLTPRLAGANNATTAPRPPGPQKTHSIHSEPPTVRLKQTSTPSSVGTSNSTNTPRLSVRSPRLGQGEARAGNIPGTSARVYAGRPKSLVGGSGDGTGANRPLVRSPGSTNATPVVDKGGFFHASDVSKQQDAVQQKPEPKKPAAFFYADGQTEARATSPALSAVSDQKSTGPWIRSELVASPPKSPPLLSPSLSSLSSASPFFGPGVAQNAGQRPAAPAKENIHLSYRKGVSQIFGTPAPSPAANNSEQSLTHTERRASRDPAVAIRHQKSPSLSSIDLDSPPSARRRSATALGPEATPSPLARETKVDAVPPVAEKPFSERPSIDTSLVLEAAESSTDGPLMSPTKVIADTAADARRERKVLDLEISNSSLLAINASLEREVRRQKAELKRFRRLSRAGRFTTLPDRTRLSDGLSILGEEGEDADSTFGPASGLSELYSDISDDDDDDDSSLAGSTTSPTSRTDRESNRLAKDEKRLQVDLAKHKELLVQSQAMNQSIKRCTYATEDMIREGKKALDYHVRVSDVKLGGRVLSSHEDEDAPEIEVEDDHNDLVDMEQAKGFLDVWGGIGRPSVEGSDGGDRDSGIEVDRFSLHGSLLPGQDASGGTDSGRPPGERS